MRHPLSNAPEGYPSMSPAGLPLYYPGVNHYGQGEVAGPPTIRYDYQDFRSDEEVEAYKVQRKAWDAAAEKVRADLAATYNDGLFPAVSITPEEGFYLRACSLVHGMKVWNVALAGSLVEMSRVINNAFYNYPVNYDPSVYVGRCRIDNTVLWI
jgi:hypothetical protein